MKKVLIVVGAFLVLIIAVVGIALATFDINRFRPQIIDALSAQTGRTIKLGDPIKLSLSSQGIVLGIKDAAINNPSWASRPTMAGVGTFQLAVALLPLLSHQLVVTGLSIENADIELESASGNRHNWDFQPVSPAVASPASLAKVAKAPPQPSSPNVSLKVDRVSVKNSQITLRDQDGKATVFKTEALTLGSETGGLGIHFKGDFNGTPIALDVKSNSKDVMSTAVQALSVHLTFANLAFEAQGKASLGDKKAAFDSYKLSAGKSDIHGAMAVAWGGTHPSVQGTVESDSVTPADFKMPDASGAAESQTAPAAVAPSGPKLMFSNAPLPLDALKSLNANLDIAIGSVPVGVVSLKDVSLKVALADGKLSVAPLKATLGGGTIEGQVGLDASGAPAHLAVTLKATGVDISSMLELWGAEAVLSGKSDADMTLSGYGNSMHAIASSLNGTINVVTAGGDVVTSAAGKVSSGLMDILSPGSGGGLQGMNCLAARFIAINGTVKDNGILLDTAATTVMGKGNVDMRDEVIDMTMEARSKVVDVGGLLPSLHVGGTLAQPSFKMNPNAVMKNVAGLLSGGSMGDSAVPTMEVEQGQNACIYTLNHPTAANPPSKGGVVQGLSGKASDQVNKIGGKLMKGLFGQ